MNLFINKLIEKKNKKNVRIIKERKGKNEAKRNNRQQT